MLVDIQQTPTGLTNETEDEEDDDDNDNDDDDDEHKTLLRLDDDARTKQNMVFYKHRGWFFVLVPSVFWVLCLLIDGSDDVPWDGRRHERVEMIPIFYFLYFLCCDWRI